ncbi:hypothetical protein IQ07DRAFT_622658 [Pyrenochaeta sp. DS3sAY3a]|nr:hypothetical protein IQ07DRAFT_622658 [Pyrenochaeta sp. DS3sAY3a]
MRISTIAVITSVSSLSTAQLTYNVTQAFQPGNWEKYNCIDNAKLSSWLPSCLHQCQADANKADGCAEDDFVCHCVNYTEYSNLIEPCAFPPELGGHGTCTVEELGKARPVINDLCNFLNATLYTDYCECKQKLSKDKTYHIVDNEKAVVSY